MADLSIITANVAPNSCNIDSSYLSGAAINPGQSVYLDTTVSPANWKLAKGDAAATSAGIVGIALNSASASGQPLDVAKGGTPNIGANPTPAAFILYGVSRANAGGIAPYSTDLSGGATGTMLTLLGQSDGLGGLVMVPNGPWPTGVAHP